MPSVFSALIATLAVATATANVRGASHLATQFNKWKAKHGKTYEGQVHSERFKVWSSNHAYVKAHNKRADAGMHTYWLGMNAMADLTISEYRQNMLGYRSTKVVSEQITQTSKRVVSSDVPDSMDWRQHGFVNKVKNQASCGSCWAFSATAAMEGAFNQKMANKTLPSQCDSKCGPNKTPCCSFSEQEIVDCTLDGKDTCKLGGEMHDGYLEIINHHNSKINTESQYPYTSGGGTSRGVCHAKDSEAVDIGITGYVNVTYGDEDALKAASAAHSIISIGIDASSMNFQLYDHGVYNEPDCHKKPAQLDHGVAIVGYGTTTGPSPSPGPGPSPSPGPQNCPDNLSKKKCEAEKGCHWCAFGGDSFCFSFNCPNSKAEVAQKSTDGTDYWIVRNSWGESWGMEGYIWMSRNQDNQCGVASDATYPVFS